MTRLQATPQRIAVIGAGSIASGVLPLLRQQWPECQLTLLAPEGEALKLCEQYGARVVRMALSQASYAQELEVLGLERGDFLVNLSVSVSSSDLVDYCQARSYLYVDTAWEHWEGAAVTSHPENAVAMAARKGQGRCTAVVCHGANPGLVQHFTKQALLNMATECGVGDGNVPTTPGEWARLAQALEVRVIHIAERDTQASARHIKKAHEFVNTWSVVGLIEESLKPAEMAWGSHEKALPHDAASVPDESTTQGASAAQGGLDPTLVLQTKSMCTRVLSWCPIPGPQIARMVNHPEPMEMSRYLTILGPDGKLVYRPSAYYAYHLSDDAEESLDALEANDFAWPKSQDMHIYDVDEIADGGVDQLGVLLMGNSKGAYWYGSTLSIDETKRLVPHNNATSLQVTCSVLAAMQWALAHPTSGLVEPMDMDFEAILQVAMPYLGKVHGEWTTWTPLQSRHLAAAMAKGSNGSSMDANAMRANSGCSSDDWAELRDLADQGTPSPQGNSGAAGHAATHAAQLLGQASSSSSMGGDDGDDFVWQHSNFRMDV